MNILVQDQGHAQALPHELISTLIVEQKSGRDQVSTQYFVNPCVF